MKKAIIIEPSGTASTELLVGDIGNAIRQTVGGWFDCVYREDFVGYVNDEGLINGEEFNPIASIVFGRYLAGRVVILGSMTENGECDGADYDAPPNAYNLINFVMHAKSIHDSHKVTV